MPSEVSHNKSKINSSAWKWCELLCFYLLFPTLIVAGFVDLKYRWVLFALTFVYLLPIVFVLKPTLPDFGISKEIALIVVVLAFLYACVAALVLTGLLLSEFLDTRTLVIYLSVFIIYPLISAPIQEHFFRSYFFYRYKSLVSKQVLILLNILLFAFYHKIYGGWLAVWLSVIGGAILTMLFSRYKNYFLVCLVHGILGVLVFLAGLGGYFTDLI